MQDQMTAPRAVKAARALRGQSQQDLADRLTEVTGGRWDRRMVTTLEGGHRRITLTLAVALSEAQDMPLSWYAYGLDGDPRGGRPNPGWVESPDQMAFSVFAA